MTQIQKALILASAMLGLASLAVLEIVPEWVGQFGPIALLALFPGAWIGHGRGCGLNRGTMT